MTHRASFGPFFIVVAFPALDRFLPLSLPRRRRYPNPDLPYLSHTSS